jgi:hypothetical protein
MSVKKINIGLEGNDATGDPIRVAFTKVNENFDEIYKAAGIVAGLSFTSLSEYDADLVANTIFMVDPVGQKILPKTLQGDGITLDYATPGKIILRSKGGQIINDSTPVLGGDLNARNLFTIFNLKDGDQTDVTKLAEYGVTNTDSFAITRGFANLNYVNVSGDTMTGALIVPAGATGTQVPRVQEVVTLGGSDANRTMTAPLYLSDHPGDIAGQGSPNGDDDLQAATKLYVDTTSFSSVVNLYVSTNGDDFRFNVPDEKRGRALAYSFKSVNQACFKAIKIIEDAANELGPYQKPIFYGSSTYRSVVDNIMLNNGSTTEYTLTITNGNIASGTDMRGTPNNVASLDVRAGHLIRGTTSGATVVIDLIGSINVSAGTENYQVHYTPNSPEFIEDEELEYGEAVKAKDITIYIESGEYFENLPIRVPNNVSICGDDLRRVIIRPRPGISCSIWSDTYFRRDPIIDGLQVTQDSEQPFGYHYLSDSTKSFYSKTVTSPGGFTKSLKILHANRAFIQDEMVAYIDYQIAHNVSPYIGLVLTTEQKELCHRDIGSIVDALGFDLMYGGYSKSLEAAMSFFMNPSALLVVNNTNNYLTDALTRLSTIVKRIIKQLWDSSDNQRSTGTPKFGFPSYSPSETDFETTINSLILLMKDILNEDPSINKPLKNDEMDVFMLNDSNRIRTLSGQGHGGFMCVLDPAGQILTKSPYIQQCSSFAKSINKQHFAGGVFVDAFTGNLQCSITARSYNSTSGLTTITVTGLTKRVPQLPTSFFYEGVRFEIDFITPVVPAVSGSYILYLSQSTPDVDAYTKNGVLLTAPVSPATKTIEIQTAGNRSMLASDFTQINDLGYGIFVTNNAFFEAVSVFTYYNYRAYYALNGAQIRSLNGSCGYGKYALSAEGRDPTEVPTGATLKEPMVKILPTYYGVDFPDANKKGDLAVYVTIANDDKTAKPYDVPFTTSEIEIDHTSAGGGFTRYAIKNAVETSTSGVYVLNFDTTGNTNTDSLALKYDLPNSSISIIVRNLREFELEDLASTDTTRSSNALRFTDDTNVYHILQYIPDPDYDVNPITAVVDLNESFNYITITPKDGGVFGAITDTKIDVESTFTVDELVLINSGNMIFGWGSKVLGISGYTAAVGLTSAFISLKDAGYGNQLGKSVLRSDYPNKPIVLRAGFNAGVTGSITTQISLMRATGHDLVDIGTGSFADSNIPANIYGVPANTKRQENEVREIGEGRVFYATTDQDGNIRFGKYFSVNQGTGTVKFAANTSISNLDGLGFTHGLEINEFSADPTFSRHSAKVVPVESAISDFVSRRLGLTYNGPSGSYAISSQKLGPGFLSLDGLTPFGNGDPDNSLNMDSHRIVNLSSPTTSLDATNKGYVDAFFRRSGGVSRSIDSFVMSSTTDHTISNVSRTTSSYTVTLDLEHAIMAGDYIRLSSINSPYGNFQTASFTATATTVTTNTISISSTTKLAVNDKIIFTGTGFGNLTSGTTYYVKTIGSGNITLSLTLGGVAVSLITDTGTMTGYQWVLVSSVTSSTITYRNLVTETTSLSTTTTSGILVSNSNIGMNNSRVIGLGSPINTTDATTKGYVDSAIADAIATKDQLSELSDVTITSPANNNLFIYNGAKWVNGAQAGDVTFAISGNTATSTIGSDKITNSMISSSAAIVQSKLSLSDATAAATSGAATKGISSFNSGNFTATSGYVSLADNGIVLGKLETIGDGYVLGNNSGATTNVSKVTFANALDSAITLPAAGLIARGSTASFSTISYAVETGSNTIVQRDASGNFGANIITASFNGSIETRAITTGDEDTTGTITGRWSLVGNSRLTATYADLAEYYEADNGYDYGTVVMIGGDKEITIAKGQGNTKVAGVVSKNPAFIMNEKCKGIKLAIALQGRVPCRVVGTVRKGDLLVVSMVPGVAMVSDDPKAGSIIGKALGNYDSSRVGLVEVLVGKH